MASNYVLSVMARDRVGIVSGIASAVLELGGTIDAISQTVMRGYFTIIVTVQCEDDVSGQQLAEAVRETGAEGELQVSVQEREVLESAPVVAEGEQWILTMRGADRKGLISSITSYLASRNANINDLYAYTEDDEFVLVAELLIPLSTDIEHVKMDLEGMFEGEELLLKLQHEDIFNATNHVDFKQRRG